MQSFIATIIWLSALVSMLLAASYFANGNASTGFLAAIYTLLAAAWGNYLYDTKDSL
jgi:hypothetical protein